MIVEKKKIRIIVPRGCNAIYESVRCLRKLFYYIAIDQVYTLRLQNCYAKAGNLFSTNNYYTHRYMKVNNFFLLFDRLQSYSFLPRCCQSAMMRLSPQRRLNRWIRPTVTVGLSRKLQYIEYTEWRKTCKYIILIGEKHHLHILCFAERRRFFFFSNWARVLLRFSPQENYRLYSYNYGEIKIKKNTKIYGHKYCLAAETFRHTLVSRASLSIWE